MSNVQPTCTFQPALRGFLALLLVGSINGCTPVDLGFLAPAGKVASEQRDLFLWIIGLTLIVVLPVIVLTPVLLWRYRYGQRHAAYRPRWDFSLPMEILSWGVPVLVVIALGVLTWQRTHQLDPYKPLAGTSAPLEIQVIAMDWKWLFIYPQQRIASLNELVIPIGRAVHLSLTSATVMQALFIPRLSGQIYAMAGMRTQQYLQADVVGEFIGRNSQFSGAGFQAQHFKTRSMSAQAFDDWAAQTRQSGEALNCKDYLQLSQTQSLSGPLTYRDVQAGLFDEALRLAHPPGKGCIAAQVADRQDTHHE